MSLVRSNSRDILASMPAAPQQELSLLSTGDILVMMEVPRIGSDFRSFRIELVEKQTGQATTMKYSYVTAQGASYGFSTMQVPFGRMRSAARRSLCRANSRIATRKRIIHPIG